MDDDGQMLLLGAVLLILGFFALASFLGRVPDFVENAEGRSDPLLDEADALLARLPELLCDTSQDPAVPLGDYDARLAYLAAIERSRGFTLREDGTQLILSNGASSIRLADPCS